MAPTELVCLDVPAQPAFVGVARSVIATVATAIEGIGDDRLEDLRLAVSEACTNAVEAGSDKRMVLRAVHDGDVLEVSIEDAGRGLGSEGMASNGFGLQLLTALVDEVTFLEQEGGGTAVRLRMELTDI
jgi:serine/threonine-protein kinase RsbW